VKLRALRRPTWLVFVAAALVALVVLAVFGLRPLTVREVALDVPNQVQVAALQKGHQVCEGPLTAPTAVQGVGVWGGPVSLPSRTTVSLQAADTHRTLASATIRATAPAEYRTLFKRAVGAGRALRVCLRETGNSFSLLGSPSVDPHVVMTGAKPGLEFSLVLLRRSGQSLLGSLPEAFDRAALFKLSWIGSWTFWALAGGLLATIVLGAFAIAIAAAADDQPATEPDSPESRASSASSARQ
jgi:hypothetical protein